MLESRTEWLKKSFESLVHSIRDSFIENHVPLERLQNSVAHIPLSLKFHLSKYFEHKVSKVLSAKSVGELFVLLSGCWDYLNPGLLKFLVGRFSPQDIDVILLQTYLEDLKQFRLGVNLEECMCSSVSQTDVDPCFYKQMVVVLGKEWKRKTLQDLEKFKVNLFERLNFQPFLARAHVRRPNNKTVTVHLQVPCWTGVMCMDELEPFFQRSRVLRVSLSDVCLFKHVGSHTYVYSSE